MNNMKTGILKKSDKYNLKKNLRRDVFLLLVLSLLSSLTLLRDFSLEHLIGGFFISAIAFGVYYKDILRYRPEYIRQYNLIILLGILIIGTLSTARLVDYLASTLLIGLGDFPAETARYILPISAGAMLVTLLFDFHSALVFSFITSILAGIWLSDATMPLYFFTGSLVASFSTLRCKKQSDIIKGGIFVGIANILVVIVLLLFSKELFSGKAVPAIIFASISGFGVATTVSIALPILEHIFKKTTDISLLELLDLNQPLMKNLMITAPGTYHHSIIVGTLVEASAEAVGVNPLLARVSAFYHDIGKMKMPEYFVENQAGSVSKHDKLNPHMSSMILISHVKEGIELASRHKLPQMIIDIIEQHHGTNLITYFYQKAKTELGENLPEGDYRYPGPKPQTRVSALVMLADAVEAASRVLKEPTPSRIEALVDKIVNHVFLDGQLDECELTLKDISLIKKHFTYILTGIFHKRIDYPGFDFEPERPPKPKYRSVDDGNDNKPAETGKNRPAATTKGHRESSESA